MSQSQMHTPGRGSAIVAVVLCAILLGVIAGIGGRFVGLPPAVLWVILAPNVVLVWRLFVGRRTAPPGDRSRSQQVLLDASNTGGRVIQTLLPLIGVVLGAAGVTMLFQAGGGVGFISVVTTIAGVALIVWPLRTVIRWETSYKGHAIRFENDPCFGERLLIDGQLVDRGGVGLHMELSGTIASGTGASDVIRATSFAGIPTFHVRIVAESVAGTGPRA